MYRNHYSPFEKRARNYGYTYKGGKSDDITIILAQIVIPNKKEEL